jgi:cytochrome c oxidase cbb3-type subunit 3
VRRALVPAIVGIVAIVFASGCQTRSAESHSIYAGRTYAGDLKNGEHVFDTNCATCHGAGGRSGGVGPSLIDENQRQDLARTIVWIENPDPPMPRLYPSPLDERDVEDVAAFVQGIR